MESPRDPPARVTHPTLTTSASAKGLLQSIPWAPPSNLCHPPHLTWTFLQVPGRVWPGEPLSFSDCCRVPTSCGVILSHTETNHVSPTTGNRHTCVLTLTKFKKKKNPDCSRKNQYQYNEPLICEVNSLIGANRLTVWPEFPGSNKNAGVEILIYLKFCR